MSPLPLFELPLPKVLGSEGSDWSELDPVVRSFNEGMGGRVGSGANWLDAFEVLDDDDDGNNGAGLPAWASSIQPARKDTALVIMNQIRRPNLIGFMTDKLL